jgi:erythromycin esterase
LDTQPQETSRPQEDVEPITVWIRRNSFPLEHIEAGNGFADLQPLKEILKDVRAVGLGEATHGTREFFQIKHRLLEFLVLELAFTTFVVEASYAASQAINEYVLHGVGGRAAVLTGLGYVPWDTEEFSAMLDWIRVYNQGVSVDRKVRFLGEICGAMRLADGVGLSAQRRA